jgi:hypothetical protein
MHFLKRWNPLLIAPECHAADCQHAGDQYTMIKCRCCEQWYCSDHVDTQETVQLVKTVDRAFQGLSYYMGLCLGCRGEMRQQRPTNSHWLLE